MIKITFKNVKVRYEDFNQEQQSDIVKQSDMDENSICICDSIQNS